jgi:hypothetical protein
LPPVPPTDLVRLDRRRYNVPSRVGEVGDKRRNTASLDWIAMRSPSRRLRGSLILPYLSLVLRDRLASLESIAGRTLVLIRGSYGGKAGGSVNRKEPLTLGPCRDNGGGIMDGYEVGLETRH